MEKTSKARYVIMIIIVIIAAAIFCARLVSWQVLSKDYYDEIALTTSTYKVSSEAIRGEIYDANGVPLAVNKTGYRIVFNKIYLKDESLNEIIVRLTTMLSRTGDKCAERRGRGQRACRSRRRCGHSPPAGRKRARGGAGADRPRGPRAAWRPFRPATAARAKRRGLGTAAAGERAGPPACAAGVPAVGCSAAIRAAAAGLAAARLAAAAGVGLATATAGVAAGACLAAAAAAAATGVAARSFLAAATGVATATGAAVAAARRLAPAAQARRPRITCSGFAPKAATSAWRPFYLKWCLALNRRMMSPASLSSLDVSPSSAFFPAALAAFTSSGSPNTWR